MPRLVQHLTLILLLATALPAMSQRSRTDTLVAHFAFNKSDVKSADSAALTSIHHNADSILIIGYTDTVGTQAYNQALSYRRAEAIKTTLAAKTTSAEPAQANTPSIKLEARGKTNPLPGDDSLSRRVEIFVFYKIADTQAVAKRQTKPADEPDTAFGLENINFVANTPILTDAAREALPASTAHLRVYKNQYLEIDGFCNQPGATLKPTDPLFILSVKRAKFIYDYLLTQGFDSTHLSYKGKGNTQPLNAHPTTAAEMDQNMRVEIKVFSNPPKNVSLAQPSP